MSLPSISTGSALLSNATTSASTLGNLILAVPNILNGSAGYQPQNAFNPDGTPSVLPQPKSFLFDYEGEQSTELMSDITDHYIENNSAIQDQIALKPVKITTKGFISELNDIPPAFLLPFKIIAQKLTSISSYAPGVSSTASLAYNEAFLAYQTGISLANAAVAAWSSVASGSQKFLTGSEFNSNQFATSFPTVSPQTRQQIAFQIFYGYWLKRTFFTIQTPWAIFANMAIERIKPIQSEDTQTYTTFECTFKQIRTVQSAFALPQSFVSQGRLANQSQPLNSLGTSTPQSDISLGTGLTGPDSASYPGLFPTNV